jgi:hypothetical protein
MPAMKRRAVLLASAGAALALGIAAAAAGGSRPSFTGPHDYPAGQAPLWLVAADVNGDARQDLVTDGYYTNRVSVLLGQRRRHLPLGGRVLGRPASVCRGCQRPQTATAGPS